jgi:purine-binding chemotaxis protein CheW
MKDLEVVIVRAANWLCAFDVRDVVETCRALPTQAVAGCPDYVDGISVVRGSAVVVVHLGALLSGSRAGTPARFATVRVGGRSVALAVDQVLGVRRIGRDRFDDAPPLFPRDAEGGTRTLALIEGELVALLETARLVDEELLAQITAREGA